ncbi:MAG: hypothetical protein SGJ11_05770 [Phycisphaerae bacterium]|nr:hypothetical protein [Phycisphaerae bacterium]
MTWPTFLILLVVAVVLDSSFAPVFAIEGVQPDFTPALVVFVAMYAARPTTMWAAFVGGLLVDLTTPALFEGLRPYQLIGPTILGYVFGAMVVIPLRTIVVRKNPLAFGFLVVLFAIAAMLVTTSIHSARGWYAGTLPPWMEEEQTALRWMWHGTLEAVASGVLAILLAWPLQRMLGAFGFSGAAPWSSRRN